MLPGNSYYFSFFKASWESLDLFAPESRAIAVFIFGEQVKNNLQCYRKIVRRWFDFSRDSYCHVKRLAEEKISILYSNIDSRVCNYFFMHFMQNIV
jgi:hypothetical protein